MQAERKHNCTLDMKYTYCLQLNCKHGENAFKMCTSVISYSQK